MQILGSTSKRRLGLVLALSLLPATKSFALTFERAVEAPPAIYAQGPTLTGRTRELQLNSVDAVNYVCSVLLHAPARTSEQGGYYTGCYAPALDIVVLMQPSAWPSRREWEAIRVHEWAHARGWRHHLDGTGTDWLASLPPPGGMRNASSKPAAPRPAG